jgi:hypothetical protein
MFRRREEKTAVDGVMNEMKMVTTDNTNIYKNVKRNAKKSYK